MDQRLPDMGGLEAITAILSEFPESRIAATLGITHETAKVHVKNILARFGVNDRMAAVNIALQRGIIHVS